MELEEIRSKSMQDMEFHQSQTMNSFDRRARVRNLKIGDVVLKWDEFKSKPGKHTKFDALCGGPFVIIECSGSNAF